MRNKKILFISILLFMVVLSIGAISAQDADDAIASSDNVILGESQTVSGDVYFETENPWDTSGELNLDIPSDAKSIKSADLYVNVYGGSASNTYGANAKITITPGNNSPVTYAEALWTEEGSTDGTVYTVNDHTTKCYSDYMIHYDITNELDGLSGIPLKINVDTYKMENKSFDGRIKLIALVLGYDDGDDDEITYWINDDQLWTKGNTTITFDTKNANDFHIASLANVVLSSGDGTYKLNGEFLDDAIVHESGNYYQMNMWDVTDVVKTNQDTNLDVIYAGTSAYGSIKNVLSLLMTVNIATEISLAPEYTSVPSAYAGTNNTMTVKVKTTLKGNYTVKLLADGVEVDSTNVTWDKGENTILLTDPTIRDIDATTVNGAENNYVNYTAELYLSDILLNSNEISIPVLYNGNLGSDYEYNITGFEDFGAYYFNGDIVIDIKDVSSYLGASAMNRTDIWTVDLDENSEITTALIYVPYNWFNGNVYTEDTNMFNITFNDATITPIAWYRDQGNLGNYGKYGYGVLIYEVSDLIAVGDNTLTLNKVNPTPAVYPSALVYMYDTEGSTVLKTAYILNGADLLSNANNKAGRIAKADTEIDVDTEEIVNATLYVFAASAQTGESNIVFNDNVYENVWNGTSSTTDLFTTDVTGIVNDTNTISFVATGSTILALPQIIVTSKNIMMNTSLITPSRIISVANGISGYDYQFILKDESGNALAGKEVLVSFNGKNQTVTTDENGWGTATVKAGAEGTYDVTVTFEGDGAYYGVSQSATIKLVKEKTYFVAPDRTVYVQQMSRGYTYSAILKDQNGNVLANKKVLFQFNGKSIVTYTDESGYATVKLTADTAGTQTVTIKFAGTTSCYYETSITKTIKIVRESTKLSVPDVTFKSSAAKKVTATLKSKSDNPVNGAKLTLTVNGKTYTATTDNSGIATFSIDITQLGIFSATTKFADSRFFAATSVTSKITIN